MANLTDIRSSWSTGASEGGVTVYATKEDLPTSGLTSGDQAYVTSNSRFYISNGSGWYNVALVNATPALTISPTGVIELSTEGTATTITLTATDSDNAVTGLSYSVESDGSFAGLASISQDSSVFTITPLSEDSATTSSAVLTFKASDGISFGTGDRTLTLSFKVENSNYTTLLLKNEETTDNQVDASGENHAINTGAKSTAFSPYHPGGYSTYFDGTGDYLSVAYNSNLDLTQSSTTTIEAWIYLPAAPDGNKSIITNRPVGVPNEGMDLRLTSSRTIQYYETGASSVSGSTVISLNTWTHVAVIKTGGNAYIYINGTLDNSGSFSNGTAGTNPTFIGRNGGDGTQYINAYIKDVRVVNGTAVYTSAFTPPTAPLTAIANTSLLACHLPYIADGSTNGHTITINGNTSTKRFGPYDYLGYTKADHGGSLRFNSSTNDYMTTDGAVADADFTLGTGDFTIEYWSYWTGTNVWITVDFRTSQNQAYPALYRDGGTGALTYYVSGANKIVGSGTTGTIYANVWNHIALVRNSGTTTLYKDGVSVGSFSDSTNYASGYWKWGRNENTWYFDGWASDMRLVKGTAVYTSNFTPPTAPLTAITNTKLLTATNKNDIWDAASGNPLTKAGDVTGGANSGTLKFGQTAVYFDGTGDSISFTAGYDDPLYNFGTHDWTLEGWFYIQTLSSGRNLFSFLRASANEATPHVYTQGTDLRYYVLGADRIIGSSALTVNTWHHIAATRSGNDHKLFVDGTQVGSTWTNAQTYVQGRPVLGDYHSSLGNLTGGSNLLHGYAQDFRITKGLARYTGTFTPPTAEFDG